MTVYVTTDDIEDGVPEDEQLCPIALAIKRLRPKSYILVNEWRIRVDAHEYRTPREAEEFIWNFDDRWSSVQPFSFEL